MSSVKLFQEGDATGSVGQIVPNTKAKIIAIDDPTGEFKWVLLYSSATITIGNIFENNILENLD